MKPREPRRKVRIKARMRLDGVWGDVCICNISSRGLLLQTCAAPPRGTYVELFRGQHIIVARVVWAADRQFGVHTQDRINIDAVVESTPSATAGPAAAGKPPFERRTRSRPSAAELAGRSRLISRAFEFGCIALFCVSTGVVLFSFVERTLRSPLDRVKTELARSG